MKVWVSHVLRRISHFVLRLREETSPLGKILVGALLLGAVFYTAMAGFCDVRNCGAYQTLEVTSINESPTSFSHPIIRFNHSPVVEEASASGGKTYSGRQVEWHCEIGNRTGFCLPLDPLANGRHHIELEWGVSGNSLGETIEEVEVDRRPPTVVCSDCDYPPISAVGQEIVFAPRVEDESGEVMVKICGGFSCKDPYCSFNTGSGSYCTYTVEPGMVRGGPYWVYAADEAGNQVFYPGKGRRPPRFDALRDAGQRCIARGQCLRGDCVKFVCNVSGDLEPGLEVLGNSGGSTRSDSRDSQQVRLRVSNNLEVSEVVMLSFVGGAVRTGSVDTVFRVEGEGQACDMGSEECLLLLESGSSREVLVEFDNRQRGARELRVEAEYLLADRVLEIGLETAVRDSSP